VEEPARRWMRRMIDFRDVKHDRHTGPPGAEGTRLASVDQARDARPPQTSARAG
jgi:hypothetical protein